MQLSKIETNIKNFGIPLLYLLAFGLTWYVKDNAFFWDTVQLGSIHSHFYFENNFQSFFLPATIDSGHPPTFGIYIALMWKCFGKSLATSHFAMLPVIFGIIFYLRRVGVHLFNSSLTYVFPFLLWMLLDPCIGGHFILVSPDVMVLLFFIISCDGIFNKNKTSLVLGIIGLCIMSTRGMMVAAAMFSYDFLNFFFIQKNDFNFKKLFQKTMPYWLGGFSGLAFLILHYWKTGWVGYHPGSSWAPAFEKVGLQGGIKNIMILGWRLLDFGRVFLWIVLFFLSFKIFREKIKLDMKSKQLILLFFCLMFFMTPALIMHKQLSGHRYLIPLFLSFNFIAAYFIFKYATTKPLKRILFSIAFFGLVTGNLWIYPKQIAQSWDTTLAVLPYFNLRNQMKIFIEKEKIPYSQIGSVFPNVLEFKYLDLIESQEHFMLKDFEKQEYMFYSNVYNDFTDEEIEELEKNWKVVKSFKKNRICVILYKR